MSRMEVLGNMKKYKLIKTYPGSPELGTIASRGMGVKFEYPNGDVGGFSSSKGRDFESLIENQPEFWEEVVEKEYEILSIAADPNKYICTDKNDIKNFINRTGMSLYNIHSIKRLSDGGIFTVGDDISHSYRGANNETITKEYKIERIYFIEKERLSFYVGNGLNLGIKNVLKLKQPLFTSEDGVEIYKGDTVYCFNNDYSITEFHNIQWKLARRIFSTKEAAEEYLLMNKPCLSINDFLLNKDTSFNALVVTTLSRLRELAKSKLYESKN